MKFAYFILSLFVAPLFIQAQTNIIRTAVPAPMVVQTNAAAKIKSIPIDGYAAKVNERVITRGEVHAAMAQLKPELFRRFQGAQLDEELHKAFILTRNDLIERALIMQAFATRGGQIPDQYVNDEIKRMINDRFKGDEAQFEELLAQQKKTREEYMEIIREQMAVSMMSSEEVSRRARITPEQLREEYEKTKETYFIPEKMKYSLIVLNKGATPEDQAVKREEATKIRQRLIEGADFAETAKEVSEGSRAEDGGAFPWMQPKDVRPELRETMKKLPAGEISEIVETDTQLYLIKLEARRQPGVKAFDEVREDIKNGLIAQERKRLRKRWIARLKEKSYIIVYE